LISNPILFPLKLDGLVKNLKILHFYHPAKDGILLFESRPMAGWAPAFARVTI
jgi:hypothetical protein